MTGIMITGGTGAFGNAFVRRMLAKSDYERIVVYSRGEYRQFQMAQELANLDTSKRLRFMIGDVRDKDRLRRAMHNVTAVVHAAALKRIEVGHYNPIEMVRTNVDGAINVIEAAQDAGVCRVCALSSDKAFQPISPYGTSKALAESLFLAANNTVGWNGPIFSVCRYGNVWGSTGSVVPVWRGMIEAGMTPVPITDPDCTRFFMRMNEAIDLVLTAIECFDRKDKPFIPTLPAYRLGDLADAMGVRTRKIGLPHWEKMHESMDFGLSSDKAERMTVAQLQKELGNV